MVGADTNGTPSSLEVTFGYDALGRRVSRTESGSTVIFYQAGHQTIADYASGAAPASPTYRYVYGDYIDEPVMRETASGSVKHFSHRNQQYSIAALTDNTGFVIERYVYSAYGKLQYFDASGTIITTSNQDSRFAFTGREWESELELYHFRARWFDPSIGQFVSRDPSGFDIGFSVYPFAAALSGVDPSGLRVVQGPGIYDQFPQEVKDAYAATCEENCQKVGEYCNECDLRKEWHQWTDSFCKKRKKTCLDYCKSNASSGDISSVSGESVSQAAGYTTGAVATAAGIGVGAGSAAYGSGKVKIAGLGAGGVITAWGWWSALRTIQEARKDKRQLMVKQFEFFSENLPSNKQGRWGNCRGSYSAGVFYPGQLDQSINGDRNSGAALASGFWIRPCDQSDASEGNINILMYGHFEGGWQKTLIEAGDKNFLAAPCLTFDQLARIESHMACADKGKKEPSLPVETRPLIPTIPPLPSRR